MMINHNQFNVNKNLYLVIKKKKKQRNSKQSDIRKKELVIFKRAILCN